MFRILTLRPRGTGSRRQTANRQAGRRDYKATCTRREVSLLFVSNLDRRTPVRIPEDREEGVVFIQTSTYFTYVLYSSNNRPPQGDSLNFVQSRLGCSELSAEANRQILIDLLLLNYLFHCALRQTTPRFIGSRKQDAKARGEQEHVGCKHEIDSNCVSQPRLDADGCAMRQCQPLKRHK